MSPVDEVCDLCEHPTSEHNVEGGFCGTCDAAGGPCEYDEDDDGDDEGYEDPDFPDDDYDRTMMDDDDDDDDDDDEQL